MSYTKSSIIKAEDYNFLAGVVDAAAPDAVTAAEKAGYLWGIGYADRGYGQGYPPLSPIINVDPFTTSLTHWGVFSGTNFEIGSIGDGKVASTELRSTGATGHAWVTEFRRYPIDASKTYSLHAYVRRKSGNRGLYLVVRFFDSGGSEISGSEGDASGWASLGTSHYWGLAGAGVGTVPADSEWREYTFTMGADGAGTIPTGATHFCLGAILNYQGVGDTDGVSAVQGLYVSTQADNTNVPSWSNLRTVLSNLCDWQNTDTTELPTTTQTAKSSPVVALTRGITLQNPSFETGSVLPWSNFGSGTTTWDVIDTDAHTGTKCLRVQTGASPTSVRFTQVVFPLGTSGLVGKVVRGRGWIKRTDGSGSGTLAIRARDSGGTLIGSGFVSAGVTSSDWTLVEVSGTVPANTDRIDIEFGGSATANTTILFDDAEFFIEGFAPSIPDLLQLLDTNRLNYQIGNMTLEAANSSTRGSAWSGTIDAIFTITFTSEDHARWFFNTGGEIQISLDHPSTATPQDTSWNDALDDLTVALRAHSTDRLSGSTGTGSSIGFYELTTSYQGIYTGVNVGGGAYSANDYFIEALVENVSGVNGGNGTVIRIRITLDDQHSNVFFDSVEAGTVATISRLWADESLPNPIPAPSVGVADNF